MSDTDSESDDEETVIVMDSGSSLTKAGYAGNKTISCAIPTVICKSNGQPTEYYVGDEAVSKRDMLSLYYPIERGVIVNFEDIERIWHHIIHNELTRIERDKQLRSGDKEFSLLLTEPPGNPKANREKMLQLAFETFNAKSVCLVLRQELSLIANCRCHGVVVQSGAGITNVIAIHQHKVIHESLVRVELGGLDLEEYLSIRLTQQEGEIVNHSEFVPGSVDIINIKQCLCYVSLDYDEELKRFAADTKLHKTYKTSVDNDLRLAEECFQCPEILFQPSVILEKPDIIGIHHAVYKCICKCPVQTHADLYGNIIMSGGNTLFRGLQDRMEKEVVALAPPEMRVKVVAAPERIKSVWLGGSVFGSVGVFLHKFITRELYKESGVSVLNASSESISCDGCGAVVS